MGKNYKIPLIFLGILVFLWAVVLAFWQGQKYAAKVSVPADFISGRSMLRDASVAPTKTLEQANAELAEDPGLAGAVLQASGANPVKGDVVVNSEGKPAINSATPMSSEAPRQTPPLVPSQLSPQAIRLSISEQGFSPNKFTATAGQPLTLAVTTTDRLTHLFQFTVEDLYAVRILVNGLTTKAITFNAPAKPGEYAFRCGIPGHEQETGKMIVK